MILIIGGRSKIGSELIRLLVEKNQPVRALIRGQETHVTWPAGVEPVVGDLADPTSLSAAMQGVQKVFLLSSPHPDAVEWSANAVEAALKCDVELLVRSSIIGADRPSASEFIDAHNRADRQLIKSGLDHVILRPNMFQQNITEQTIPSIDATGTFYGNAGDARISMIDTRDIAAVAAVVLTEPGHAGGHYNLTGPEALSYADVAARLSAAMGRLIHYVDVPDDAVRSALLSAGLNQWLTDSLVGLFQDYRRSGTHGYAAAVTHNVERITGQPPRSLDDLISERSADRA